MSKMQIATGDTVLSEWTVGLRDSDIRAPLEQWLRAAHANCPDTAIVHELKIPRPSTRIDLAVINGELCGFEIKSDYDTLVRLRRQQIAFTNVFDRVSIVTTDRHLDLAIRSIPLWWGIVLVVKRGKMCQLRAALENPSRDISAIISLLTVEELFRLINDAGHQIRRSQRRSFVIKTALEAISGEGIRNGVRQILKMRVSGYSSLSNEPALGA